jgi:hypothetical protein
MRRAIRLFMPALFVAAGAAVLAGCESTGGPELRFQVGGPADAQERRLPDASVDEVRPVAERVFRQHFRIDPQLSTRTRLVSRPAEVEEAGQVERVRDVLGPSRNRRRQKGELYLVQEGSDVVVRCRVQLQRLDTAERAAFERERGDDRPGETPINRSGSTSTSLHEEWVDTGRDRAVESELLGQLLEAFRPPAAGSGTGATAPG